MKVMLIKPPQFDPSAPTLALPCLTAVLHETGHEVIQKDINIEYHEFALSKSGLERACQLFCARRQSLEFLSAVPEEIDKIIARKDFLVDGVENAKNILRSPQYFFDYPLCNSSLKLLQESYQFISMAYFRTKLSFSSFTTIYTPYATDQIFKAITDEFCNPYIDFYNQYSIPEIQLVSPQVVGISISSEMQVIPGFTLAHMIRQARKDIHLVLGGAYFSNFKEPIRKNHRVFSLFDSVIIDEGETALVELLACLEKGASFSKIPNLIYRDGSQIVGNDIYHMENLNELPTPSFEGLPLNLYFLPQPVLPVYSSRGCYWGRCAFCNYDSNMNKIYRQRNVENVIDDMKKLISKYGCNTFVFTDASLSPDLLANIAEGIIQIGLQVNWFGHTRFEKQINRGLCEKLITSGCRILGFGLESSCERILGLMNKGTNRALIKEVLLASSQAGIANGVSSFVGFPTETADEARETLKFILDNSDNISDLRIGFFTLLTNSGIYSKPKEFMIEELFHKENWDLISIYDYRIDKGLSRKEAQDLAGLFSEIAKGLHPDFLDLFLPLFLYTIYYQSRDLLWLTASEEEQKLTKETIKERRFNEARRKAARILELI
jgi:anaerobic magnesium-protoporphyrin IX monomethyl ester cyclase